MFEAQSYPCEPMLENVADRNCGVTSVKLRWASREHGTAKFVGAAMENGDLLILSVFAGHVSCLQTTHSTPVRRRLRTYP